MRSNSTWIWTVFVAVVSICALAAMAVAAAWGQEADTLAGELRKALARGGTVEAQRRFDEVWPAEKSRYPYDPQEFMLLVQEQNQAGDMEAMNALVEINARLMLDSMETAMPGFDTAMADAVAEQEERDAVAEQDAQAQSAAQHLGVARNDLGRFTGMYGEGRRQMFVNMTCDGYLSAGPMWADTAPWRMRSAADTVFTYSDGFMSFAMEFETDGDGKGTALSHDIEGAPSPMARNGDLPVEYRNCLPAPVQ